MFESEITIISKGISDWIGTGMYIALYLVSLIYIFVKVKDNKIKYVFGISSIILLLIIVNPIFTMLVKSIFNSTVYWRLFWMLPTGFTMAYVAVDVVSSCDKKSSRFIITLSFILCIILSGKLVYNAENFKEVNNLYKIGNEDYELVSLILNDKEDYKKVMAPPECVAYFRQVTSRIKLMYARNPAGYETNNSINLFIKRYEIGDVNYVATTCKAAKCNYIVLRKTIPLGESFMDYGYDYFAETDNFIIVKTKFLKKDLQ